MRIKIQAVINFYLTSGKGESDMVTMYMASKETIYKVREDNGAWRIKQINGPEDIRCVEADPVSNRIYAGTFNDGLHYSDDDGNTWQKCGADALHNRVMSLYINELEQHEGFSTIWAGTEPSMLYRSQDGGKNWRHFPNLLELPSKSTWSFPPRPHTHHVRTIQPDMHDANSIFVGIELGGMMKSEDKGESWEDRKEGSHHDSHSIKAHPAAEGRIYEAAGEGFAESKDSGKTWTPYNEGLGKYNYMVDVAADPNDPDTVIASVAEGPYSAYNPEKAYTYLVRRTGGDNWKFVEEGLPSPEGSSIFSLLSDQTRPHTFYAVNNKGIYISQDAGNSFSKIEIDWPEELSRERVLDAILITPL